MAVIQGLKENEVDKESGQTDFQKSTVSSSATGGITAPQMSTPKRQGSGRFVNLQKYIDANQGAGARMGAGIGQKVEKGFEEKDKKSSDEMKALQDAFSKGKTAIDQGQQIKTQLSGEGFNAASFGADAKNLEAVARLKQGLAVDDRDLIDKSLAFDITQQQRLEDVNRRLGQVGTESGRFGLLKETFGGGAAAPKRYGTGQQRLDQLFLQAGAGDQIKGLQEKLGQKQTLVGADVQAAQKYGTDIKGLLDTETSLGKDIDKLTQTLSEKAAANLEKKRFDIQAQRDKDVENFESNYAALMDGDPNTKPDEGFLEQLGIRSGERTYGALTRNTLLDDIADLNRSQISREQAGSAEDIANYNILRKLVEGRIGDDDTYQFSGEQLTKKDLAGPINMKRNLRSEIDAARKKFEDAVASANPIVGTGRWGQAGATETQSLQDYLSGAGNVQYRNTAGRELGYLPVFSEVQQGYHGRSGVPQEDYTAAEAIAHQNRMNQIQEFLKQYGYDHLIETGGITSGNYDPNKRNLKGPPRIRG